MQILFSFLICLLATTIGGISGVGGGVIIKPVLDAVSGMPVATVSFLSGCTVLAMTITSMIRSRRGDVKVEPRRGTLLAIGAAIGGVVGKELFELVRAAGGMTVSVAQQVMMIALTLGVLAYTEPAAHHRQECDPAGGLCVHRSGTGPFIRLFGNRRRPYQSGRAVLFFLHGYQDGCAQLPVRDPVFPVRQLYQHRCPRHRPGI